MRTLLWIVLLLPFGTLAQKTKREQVFGFRPDPALLRDVTVKPDTAGKPKRVAENRALDSIFGIRKDYAFELRLWMQGMQPEWSTVFILSQKEGAWRARYFINETQEHGGAQKPVEHPVDQRYCAQLWALLQANSIRQLPDQSLLRGLQRRFRIDTASFSGVLDGGILEVMDGGLYDFELRTTGAQRFYRHHSPQSYLQAAPNSYELASVVGIIFSIQLFLGKPMTAY